MLVPQMEAERAVGNFDLPGQGLHGFAFSPFCVLA